MRTEEKGQTGMVSGRWDHITLLRIDRLMGFSSGKRFPLQRKLLPSPPSGNTMTGQATGERKVGHQENLPFRIRGP